MAADPRIGTELAGYRIESLLGRGGMSVVYLAEDTRLGRPVALKILAPELAENEGFRERFVRESRLAASIDHPNIVPIYDAGERDDVLYIAMRYVRGTDLRTVIRGEGPVPPERFAPMLTQVASALDTAHRRGLVHRDVKPANILLARSDDPDATDHVYLTDFGLTKQALAGSGLTATGQFVGTIDYVSPEQISGKPVDGRTDVYSLGVVVFECLAGDVPFRKDAEVAVLWAHMQEPPPQLSSRRPDLPLELDDVIARAMAKDPAERYATAGELASAVRRQLGMPTGTWERPAPTAPSPAPAAPPKRSRRGVIAAAMGLVLALAAGALVLTRDGGGASAGPNTVARLAAGGSKVETWIPVGNRPQSLAIGEGSLWVVNFDSTTLSRVDLKTSKVLATLGLSAGGIPTGVAVGEGSVWVTSQFAGKLSRIDPRDNRVVTTVSLATGVDSIAVGNGSVWVANKTAGNVTRIDPSTTTVLATIVVGEGPTGIAIGERSVWVANGLSKTISRIDPATNKVAQTIALRSAPSALAVGGGSVWVTSNGDDSVTRIDAKTGNVATTIASVGNGPEGIAIAGDSVWIANSLEGTVVRIAAAANRVAGRVRLGRFSPSGVVSDGRSVWVTVSSP